MSMQPRILCLFSTPLVSPNNNPLDILDVDEECRAIIESLEECNYQVLLRLRFATVNNLAEGVRDDFNILHISCHGNENTLLFEDGKSGSQPLTGDYLKKLFSRKKLFKLVILSACHSESIAEKLVEAGVEHVISIRRDTPVLDRAATVFVHHFYAHLFRGYTVEDAFEMAKLLVEGDPDLMKMRPQLEFIAEKKGESFVPEEDKFLLLPRDSSHLKPLSVEFLEGAVDTDRCPLPKTNLPVKPQSFTGRSSDMHVIIEKIFTNRLVTITGTGGIGKTTLGREVARWFHLRGHFPDGIFSIDLRQVENAEGIIALLGATLKTPFAEPQDVVEYLRERQYLLLLDNAEDVLSKDEDRVRDLIDQILMFAPKIKFLITSQTSLGGILHEPEFVHRLYTLEQLHAFLLFYRTKRREMSEEELKSDEFYHLLDQLGGHPLSIVLMARQLVHGTTLKDLLDRIKKYKAEAIRVRTIIDRDPEHGESLATSLISAYNRLSDNAQTLFEILSLLPAGGEDFVLKDIFGETAWEYAQELNDASLAEITFIQRVVLLPPVRLFAVSILKEETKELYGPKIVEIMGQYAVTCYENLGTKDAVVYRFLFTMEEPNFRSAIELPCSPPKTKKEISHLGSLSYRLILLYNFHYRYQEAREGGDVMISNLRNLQDQLGEAYTLQALGDLAVRISDLKDGKEKYEEALSIFQEIGSNLGTANTLQALGDLAVRISDLKDGKEKYEEALEIYQEIGDNWGTATTLQALGDLAVRTENLEEAKDRYEKILEIFQEVDSKEGEAAMLKILGDLASYANNLQEAKDRYEKALEIYQEIDSKMDEADTLRTLGDLAVQTDNLEEAKDRYEKVLRIYQEIDEREPEANTLKALGDLAVRISDLKDAKEKYEKALSIFQEIDKKSSEADTLQSLGEIDMQIHDFVGAKKKYEKALQIYQEIDERFGEANIFGSLGNLALYTDDLEDAKEKYRKALEIYQEIKSKRGEADALKALGDVALRTYDLNDAKEKYEKALEIYQEIDENIGRASTFMSLGSVALGMYDLAEARDMYEKALHIYQEIGEDLGIVDALRGLGDLDMRTYDFVEARNKYEKALDIYAENNEKWGMADTLRSLGDLAMNTDNLEEAKEKYGKALEIYQEIEENGGIADTLRSLGDLAYRIDDLEEAKEKYRKALDIYQEIGDKWGLADALKVLGDLAYRIDNIEEAKEKYEEALGIYQEIYKKWGTADTLRSLGDLAIYTDNLEEAKEKFEEALEVYQGIEEKWGETDTLVSLGFYFTLKNDLGKASRYLEDAFVICNKISYSSEQPHIHMGRALILFKRHTDVEARKELDTCSSILKRVHGYGEAAQWIIFFADHLRQHGFEDGAKTCLEYAKEFAIEAQDLYLQNKVNQRLSTDTS